MKTFYFLLLVFTPILPFNESKVKWLTPLEHDFGDINHNEPVTHLFEFVNISDKLLTIDNVRTSCGCTASDWEYVPTAIADTSAVSIVYDAAKTGYFRKKIKVYFHGQRNAEILYIEGFVLEE